MIGERSLRVFVEVYQTGNIHLAAQRLYISPQSVSKTILALEAELGAPLFLRERRRMLPTPRAARLHRVSRDGRRPLSVFERPRYPRGKKSGTAEVFAFVSLWRQGLFCFSERSVSYELPPMRTRNEVRQSPHPKLPLLDPAGASFFSFPHRYSGGSSSG